MRRASSSDVIWSRKSLKLVPFGARCLAFNPVELRENGEDHAIEGRVVGYAAKGAYYVLKHNREVVVRHKIQVYPEDFRPLFKQRASASPIPESGHGTEQQQRRTSSRTTFKPDVFDPMASVNKAQQQRILDEAKAKPVHVLQAVDDGRSESKHREAEEMIELIKAEKSKRSARDFEMTVMALRFLASAAMQERMSEASYSEHQSMAQEAS